MRERLPWEIVETLPSTDSGLLDEWERRVTSAPPGTSERVRALVGRSLSSYWAVQMGLVDSTWERMRERRSADIAEAIDVAGGQDDVDTMATALLGALYALWGPDHEIDGPLDELIELRDTVVDEELALRIREWEVIRHLMTGDLDAVDSAIAEFETRTAHTDLILFRRRTELWRANLAMLRGDIDRSVGMNQDAISSTADVAGSPFSFQNVAVTLAIDRFLRRGLAALIDAVRSIRASSPRVGANWDVGLAFTLSEAGHAGEAAELFDQFAGDSFRTIPRDLNWAPTMNLIALTALNLDRRDSMEELLDQLSPFAGYDTTHGSGYASYGPMGRVVGMLASRLGRTEEALAHFDAVLDDFVAGPWTALTRLERATVLRVSHPADALSESLSAEEEMRTYDMHAWADQARELAIELRLDGHGSPIAVLRDGTWTLGHPRGRVGIADGVGMAQLVELLRRPGAALDAVDLDGLTDEALPRRAGTQELLDPIARRSLRKRLREIEAEGREEADPTVSREAEFIRRELAAASYSASESPELERAHVRVTKAIRRTISAISTQSPELGHHLHDHVSTGRQCVYTPPDALGWEVDREI